MSYTKQNWADGSVGGTPITAARLNYIETGVAGAATDAAAALTATATIAAKYGTVYSVAAYGAKGDGVTDDTAAINAATNAARQVGGRRGGVVYFPTGNYLVSSPINLYTAVSLAGEGWSMDTTFYSTSAIVAAPSFTGTAIVKLNADGQTVSDPTTRPDRSWHWARIEKLAIIGNGVTGPDGIDAGWFGEASSISNVQVQGCKSGIYLADTLASGTLVAISAFNCAYGVNFDGIQGAVRVLGLSGDNNTSLVRVKGGRSANVTIIGLKAENYTTGTGDPVIDVVDLDGGRLTLLGGWCDTSATRSSVIKLSTVSATNRPRVVVIGVDANDFYTNLLNDTSAGRTVPLNVDGVKAPEVHWNGTTVYGGQSAPVIDYGSSIKGRWSSGDTLPIFKMETSDSTSVYAALSGSLRGFSGGAKVTWSDTGVGFFGGSAVAKPSVSGAKGSNAALGSLVTALANLGLITDGTTA